MDTKVLTNGPQVHTTRVRWMGVVFVAVGVLAFWLSWHWLLTDHVISVKLTILGPLAVLGGLLSIWKPEYTGPLRPDSPKAHKTALLALCGLMALFSGINYYLLMTYHG
jgi:hypothetical protein